MTEKHDDKARAITDAEVDAILGYGVDVRGRRVFLHGDVEEETISRAIRGLYLLDTLGRDPIELFVASYGGDLDDAFALHDVVRTIRSPVITCALGKCQSAAPMLVAVGKPGERYATENCTFMLHDAKLFGNEDGDFPDQLASHVDSCRAAMERYAKLLSRYTKKRVRHWRAMFAGKVDQFFDAEQALEWGLVDAIWLEKS